MHRAQVGVLGRLLASRPEVEVATRSADHVPFALHAAAGACEAVSATDKGNLVMFLEQLPAGVEPQQPQQGKGENLVILESWHPWPDLFLGRRSLLEPWLHRCHT